MIKKTKTKTVAYRKCVIDESDAGGKKRPSLENLLTNAAKTLIDNKPWEKPIGTSGEVVHFLAHLIKKQGCQCGMLVRYEKNRWVPLIGTEDNGSTWEGEIEPKDESGKKRNLNEAALFFAVKENHVALIQTRELDDGDLRDFLVWFIQSKAGLADRCSFSLENLPSAAARTKIKDQQIKRIGIGKNAFQLVKTPDPDQPQTAKRKKYITSIDSDPMIMSFLGSFFSDNAIIDEMKKSADPGSIHVGIDISYRSRTTKDSQRVMQAIASVVGGSEEFEPVIELKGGEVISGDELTIKGKVDIQSPRGNISADDAMTRVAQWLIDKLKEKKDLM